MSRKKSLEEQSRALLKGRAHWLEPFQNWIITAKDVGEIATLGSLQAKRVLAQKVSGSNLVLDCRKSPWFRRETVVAPASNQSNWWNGAPARN